MVDYVLEGPSWSSSSISWSFATSNIGGQNAYTPLSSYFANFSSVFSSDVSWAFQQWSQVANISFSQVSDNASSDIRLGWAQLNGNGEVGVAEYGYTISGSTEHFVPNNVIEFDTGTNWVLGSDGDYHAGSANGAAFRAVALHEIGHELGLDHYNDAPAIMNAIATPSIVTLQTSDVDGITSLYGAPSMLAGTAGNDFIIGTSASETLSGGAGNDLLYSGGGNDHMIGGTGADTFYLAAPGAGIATIADFQPGSDSLAFDTHDYGIASLAYDFVSGPNAHPSSPADTFFFDTTTSYLWFDADGTGSAAAKLVGFLPGVSSLSSGDLQRADISLGMNATLVEHGASTTVYGVGAHSTLWGEAEGDHLVGGPSGNTLIAQAHNVTLSAGDGGSLLAGNAGLDTSVGGAGQDYFYFATQNAGVNTLFNFDHSQSDKIVIEGSNFGAPSGFNFTDDVGFISGANAHPTHQTATFSYDTNTSYLWFDVDGTGPAGANLVGFLPTSPALHAHDVIVS